MKMDHQRNAATPMEPAFHTAAFFVLQECYASQQDGSHIPFVLSHQIKQLDAVEQIRALAQHLPDLPDKTHSQTILSSSNWLRTYPRMTPTDPLKCSD